MATIADMAVEIAHPEWMIGDGEPIPEPGSVWTAMIELRIDGEETPQRWYPQLAPIDGAHRPHLELISSPRGCAYSFVAETVLVGAGWTVLAVHGLRFAVVGSYSEGAVGVGRFVHDTYFMPDLIRSANRMLIAVESFELQDAWTYVVRGSPLAAD